MGRKETFLSNRDVIGQISNENKEIKVGMTDRKMTIKSVGSLELRKKKLHRP